MMTTLTLVQETIDKHLIIDAAATAQQALAVEQLCKQALEGMAFAYRQYSSTEIAIQHVNQCYSLITSLLDDLWFSPHLLLLFNSLTNFQLRFEQHYGHFLQPNNVLSLQRTQELQDNVDLRLPLIISKLIEKEISVHFVQELNFGMRSLFQSSKLPKLSYVHYSYLPNLLAALENLAEDERDKAWEERFIMLLVNFNFNYAGFCNRLCEQIDKHVLDMSSKDGKEYLTERIAKVKNELPHPDNVFSLHRPHLLSILNNHYTHRLSSIEKLEYDDSLDLAKLNVHPTIRSKLSAEILAIFFRYLFYVDVFDYKTKKEAAQALSKVLHSKQGQSVSAVTLNKSDKTVSYNSATEVYRLLLKMAEKLKSDYNL